jgi:AcrR family transcriptional regulator
MTLPDSIDTADLAPRARIRDAALRLFAEHGVTTTSIRMVADAAGVSAGAVMHHFRSKEGLAEAVQEHVLDRIRRVVDGVGLDQPPHLATYERRRAFDQLIIDNPYIAGYIRRTHLEGGPAGLAFFTESYRLVELEMRELLAAGIARPLPDPEVGLVLYRALHTFHILLGPLIEQLLDVDLRDPATLERFRNAAVDLLTHPVFPSPTEAPTPPSRKSARRAK